VHDASTGGAAAAYSETWFLAIRFGRGFATISASAVARTDGVHLKHEKGCAGRPGYFPTKFWIPLARRIGRSRCSGRRSRHEDLSSGSGEQVHKVEIQRIQILKLVDDQLLNVQQRDRFSTPARICETHCRTISPGSTHAYVCVRGP